MLGKKGRVLKVPSMCKMPMEVKPPKTNGMAGHAMMSVDDARLLLC